MNLLRSLLNWFSTPPRHVSSGRKTKHLGHKKSALFHLVANGEITLADIRGNHPTKVVQRLRADGFLKPNGVADGERWQHNAKTKTDYKVYIWTGKLPDSWVKTEGYTGIERRTKPRGGGR